MSGAPLPLPVFVAERRPRWDALEALLGRLRRGKLDLSEVDALDRLYRECSADLAETRRRYPGSAAARHVNQLVVRAHAELFVSRPSHWVELQRFFAITFPRPSSARLPFFWVSAAVLVASGWLGATLIIAHPETAGALVPANLRQHIAEGRMWTDSLLEVMPPAVLSAQVMTNNIGVALGAFAGGLAWGLGTLIVLVVNGVELGSVIALCVHRGMTVSLLSFVVGHGLVELSTICIAGQAGLVLASALDRTRSEAARRALQRRGRDAVRLVLGAVPILFGIGLVEGFISPGSLFSSALRAALGVSLVSLLYGYVFRWGGRPATRLQ